MHSRPPRCACSEHTYLYINNLTGVYLGPTRRGQDHVSNPSDDDDATARGSLYPGAHTATNVTSDRPAR